MHLTSYNTLPWLDGHLVRPDALAKIFCTRLLYFANVNMSFGFPKPWVRYIRKKVRTINSEIARETLGSVRRPHAGDLIPLTLTVKLEWA